MSRTRINLPTLTVALILAGALGFFLGSRRTTPPEVTVVSCPESAPCPSALPDSEAGPRASSKAKSAAARPGRPTQDALPNLEPVDEPREALLRYIQERAGELTPCVPRSERARMTLQLEVVAGGSIRQVRVLDGNASAQRVTHCVSEHLRRWTLPAQWVSEDRTLIVSLVL